MSGNFEEEGVGLNRQESDKLKLNPGDNPVINFYLNCDHFC